jgi:hypothetical protein
VSRSRRAITTTIDYVALAALAFAVGAGAVALSTGQAGVGVFVIVLGLLGIALKIYLIRAKAARKR